MLGRRTGLRRWEDQGDGREEGVLGEGRAVLNPRDRDGSEGTK